MTYKTKFDCKYVFHKVDCMCISNKVYFMYITKQAGMSYAQPQAEAVSLNSWIVFLTFQTLNVQIYKLARAAAAEATDPAAEGKGKGKGKVSSHSALLHLRIQ
jgi:hypothetical protein